MRPPVVLPTAAGSMVNFDKCATGTAQCAGGTSSFSGPTSNVGASPFIRFHVFQTGRTNGQACSDAMPFDLCGGFLLAFPLNQQ